MSVFCSNFRSEILQILSRVESWDDLSEETSLSSESGAWQWSQATIGDAYHVSAPKTAKKLSAEIQKFLSRKQPVACY